MVPAFENYIKSRFNALAYTQDEHERGIILKECIEACKPIQNSGLIFDLKNTHRRYTEITQAFGAVNLSDRLRIEQIEGYVYTGASIPPLAKARLSA